MGKVTKILGVTRMSGIPIEQDGYWHIKWKNKCGSEDITPFGFKRKEQAVSHILTILDDQKKLYVLRACSESSQWNKNIV